MRPPQLVAGRPFQAAGQIPSFSPTQLVDFQQYHSKGANMSGFCLAKTRADDDQHLSRLIGGKAVGSQEWCAMIQRDFVEYLRAKGNRCRELAATASDPEAAQALSQMADKIENVVVFLECDDEVPSQSS